MSRLGLGNVISRLSDVFSSGGQKFASAGAEFVVVQAKAPFEDWVSESARLLTLATRMSYRRYGRVKLTDEYDPCSAVFLCLVKVDCVNCKGKTDHVHSAYEVYSLRFICGEGKPHATDDFVLFEQSEGSLLKSIQSKLFSDDPEFLSKLVSLSKFAVLPSLCELDARLRTKNKRHFSDDAFNLMLRVAFASPELRKCELVTVIYREEILRGVTTECDGVRQPVYTHAHEILGLQKSAIRMNRKAETPYLAPGYFFDRVQATALVDKLINDGKLDAARFSKFGSNCKLRFFCRHFGKVLSTPDDAIVPYGTISGRTLRQQFDSVEEGASLYLMPKSHFVGGVKAYLRAKRIRKQSTRVLDSRVPFFVQYMYYA